MSLTPLLDLSGFKDRSIMPPGDVDAVETARGAGWTLRQLVSGTAYIYSRLGKRYATPFASPYPEAAERWLTSLVTLVVYQARGWNPSDEQAAQIKEDADLARVELKEAADSQAGLFDLPLVDGADASGISKGGPLVHSEAGPYSWTDLQLEAVGNE